MKDIMPILRKGSLNSLVLAGLISASAAYSEVIYSTYNPGDPLSGHMTVANMTGLAGQQVAALIKPTQDSFLTSATLNLQWLLGSTADFQLSLRSDQNGSPGAILTTFANPGVITSGNYDFTATLPWLVLGGQSYWLVGAPSLSADSIFYWSTVIGSSSDQASTLNIPSGEWNPWQPTGSVPLAYQVSGNPVPEPSGIALFLTAGVLLLLIRFRRL